MNNTPASETELLELALDLAGRPLREIARRLDRPVPRLQLRAKGWTGGLLEDYLGATASSLPEPDFQHLGIELKTLPVNENGNPAESTYVCAVPLQGVIGCRWEDSVVKHKLARVLWVPVEGASSLPLAERRVGMPFLWSPGAGEEMDLRTDWQEHMDMITTGQVHRITARQGKYLQIRPKAPHGASLARTTLETGEAGLTLPRGFYLRTVFTRSLLLAQAAD